jgi:hypothetical protein
VVLCIHIRYVRVKIYENRISDICVIMTGPCSVPIYSDIGAEDPSLFEGEELPDSEDDDEEEDDGDSEDEAGAAVADASLFQNLGDEDLPSDSDEDDPDYKP